MTPPAFPSQDYVEEEEEEDEAEEAAVVDGEAEEDAAVDGEAEEDAVVDGEKEKSLEDSEEEDSKAPLQPNPVTSGLWAPADQDIHSNTDISTCSTSYGSAWPARTAVSCAHPHTG